MFKKKNTTYVRGYADNRMYELANAISEAHYRLRKKVDAAYIANQALCVYGDCHDGERAKRDLQNKQYAVRCAIGEYDTAVAEQRNFYKAHSDEIMEDWAIDHPTSHAIIETEIKKILQGKI